jgi:hypothetical protein
MTKYIVITINAFLFSLAFSTSLKAADGNNLLDICTTAVRFMDDNTIDLNSQQMLGFGMCLGFLEGAVNGMAAGMSGEENKAFCMPTVGGSISNGQKARIVVAYLKKNPALLHEDRLALVARAFMDAYPCSD